jgi:DNA primase
MTNQIPREFIQLLLNRIEIVDLIDNRVPLRKKSGNNFFACCPFHTEKSASFSVSQNKQFYHCFGCGAHGNAIDFVMQYDHLSFPEAIETLARQIGLEIPRTSRPTEKTASHVALYELLNEVAQFYQQALRDETSAKEYLIQRGLSGTIAKEFGIGYSAPGWDHVLKTFGKTAELKQQLFDTGMLIKKDDGGYYDRFRERIMFPILDRRGRTIGFGGRILDKGEPKYLNSPETPIFQKGHELYGLHQALKMNRQLTRALIVEGYMDVIALFQNDITYAVATLGTATTSHHLQRLFRHTSEIIFCFDGDNAGRTAASRALAVMMPLMSDGIQVRFLFLPDGEDPDSLIRKEGKEQFENRIANALTISNFFFQTIASQTDTASLEGRARFVKLGTEQLEPLPDTIFKKMMLDELSSRARLTVEPAQPSNKNTFYQQPNLKIMRPTSPLKLALMLLVQNPQLVNALVEPIPVLEAKGFTLLMDLIEMAQQQALNAGSFKECWRHHPEAATIEKLAQLEHMIPEIGIEHEFVGAIAKLKKLKFGEAIEKLLVKANQSPLSQDEKLELQSLIESNK